MALTITKENFEKTVLTSKKPVLVDFFAPWCGPCQMLGPIVDALATEVGDLAIVGKVNVEEQAELANMFKVMSVPTLVFFKDGKISHHTVGFKSKDELRRLLGV